MLNIFFTICNRHKLQNVIDLDHEDNGAFRNTFFQIMRQYDFLVIKPDGEFFLSGGHLSDAKLKQLLNDRDWTPIKDDWKKSTETKVKNGYGFFRKYDPDFHINHCF